MTTTIHFKTGDLLFRQGDASDCVLRVARGDVEILREIGENSVLLGLVREGEWLGEMGIMENRNRSATARAASDGTAEVLSASEFLDQVSRDAGLARDLIARLCIRLRAIEDKVAGQLSASPDWHLPDGSGAAPETAITEDDPIALVAQSPELRGLLGTSPISVDHLPFVVGRRPQAGEAQPLRHPDLSIDDEEPFRLSRDHFMIARSQGQLFVSDLGSTLGTIVNGQAIGTHFMRDSFPLHRGMNRIIAGGWGSPFEFILSVGQAG